MMLWKVMILNSPVLLILILLVILQITYGHLTCPGDLVPCSNGTHCIKIAEVCIDYHNCVDEGGKNICRYCHPSTIGSLACVTEVKSRLTFECLSSNEICDDRQNCINNEDEHLCGIKKCGHDYWLCEKDKKCIGKSHLCDNQNDCSDGSDEGEFCHQYLCGIDQFHCPTGECIDQSKRCDGYAHCSDGFDEENCQHLTPTTIIDSCSIPSNTYPCATSIHPICISNDRLCDGQKDCPQGDDEHNCANQCTSNSNCPTNSDVRCIQHSTDDQLCRCTKPGYHLTSSSSTKNSQICQDFNECNDSLGIYCSYQCRNTDGSFNCRCPLGFNIDNETKACQIMNNFSQPNFLILFDDYINLYNLWMNNSNSYSVNLVQAINIDKYQRFDHIQYDSSQKFILYYDRTQHAVLCRSNRTFQTLMLISNVIVYAFAYNANEKSLFLIETQSQTLRLYSQITCDISDEIKMHSWPFDHLTKSIHSMEIDSLHRQIIFASSYEFLVSNMSEPNSTSVVYSTNREIKRFIYDISFQRIFWTTINDTHDHLFPVFTCENNFQTCHDTSIILPSEWPFTFFNDGLLYPSLSMKSLEIVQIYGKDRFSQYFIIPTKETIHSFSFLDNQPRNFSNLCMQTSALTRCQEKLCLQINSTAITCLSVDERLKLEKISSASDPIHLNTQTNIQSLVNDGVSSHNADPKKMYRFRPSNTILLGMIALGVIVGVLAFLVQVDQKRRQQKALDNERRQNEQYLARDEPNLDEFNVMIDDRVSKQHVNDAREIFLENATFLLIGQRRESV